MKSLTSFAFSAILGLAAIGVSMLPLQGASAQSGPYGGWTIKRNINTQITTQVSPNITSASSLITDIPPVSVNAARKVDVPVVATAPVSMTINLYNGTDLVAAMPISAGTTPSNNTFASPQFFDGVTVSPTSGFTGTVSAKAFVIQPK